MTGIKKKVTNYAYFQKDYPHKQAEQTHSHTYIYNNIICVSQVISMQGK